MGWLTDVGNFAVGAIERDREITKEDLIIRAENLKANQKILIDQKKKKYDRELNTYIAEKKNFDIVEKANKAFDAEQINARTYASQVLPLVSPSWANLSDKMKEDMVNTFDGTTQTYKITGTEEEINKKAANVQLLINDETSKAIKDAKGNSFLINKILRKKEVAEKNLLQTIESEIKAADAIKLTEQEVDQEYVGKPVKVSGGLYGSIDKTSTLYNDFSKKNYEQLKNIVNLNSKVTSKDNNEAIKSTFKIIGITNAKDYFSENNQTKEITGFKGAGESFGNTVYSSYKHNQDFLKKNGTDYLFVKFNGDIAELPSYYGKSNMNGVVGNRIFEYAIPVSNGAILGEGGNFSFKTVLRNEDNLIVVPTANSIDFDNTVLGSSKILSDSDKTKVSKIYAQILINKASPINKNNVKEFNPLILQQIQTSLQNLKYNERNELLTDINLTFGMNLLKEGIITKEQFLENRSNNNAYNFKDKKGNTPIKTYVDNLTISKPEDNKTDNKTITVEINGETQTLKDTEEVRTILQNKKDQGNTVIIKENIDVKPNKITESNTETINTTTVDSDEETGGPFLEPAINTLIKKAVDGTITDSELIELGELDFQKVPPKLRMKYWKAKGDKQRKINQERKETFNKKAKTKNKKIINTNKNKVETNADI